MAHGDEQSSEDVPHDRVDLRPFLAPVHDQGPRGTCLAFAVTAVHELARATPGVHGEDLAEEALYWGCKQIDGNREPGSAFTSSATALDRWGQPVEECWPYEAARNDTSSLYHPPEGALDPALCHRTPLRQIEATIAEIKRWLRHGHAVAIGIWLSRGFFEDTGGRIPEPRPDELIPEGHSVAVVGYQEAPNGIQGVLVIRNSWGETWGDAGYGYLPYSYLDLGSEAWVVDDRET
jgi:C1A family cysteine protease